MSKDLDFRQLEGLGVSGLLDEGGTVLYANLFSQKHIGRISDLLAAKLAPGIPSPRDELRLRALLLFSVFEAWRSRMEGGSLGEPLALECGFDEGRIAIGVSFRLQGELPDTEQGFLLDLRMKCDQLVIRTHRVGGKLEVVSLLNLDAAADGVGTTPAPVLMAEIASEKHPAAPEVAEYIELGDLDYVALLKEEGPAAQPLPPSRAGEVIAKAFARADEEQRIEGDAAESLKSIRVKGEAEEDDNESVTILAGPKDEVDDSEFRFAADQKPEEELTRLEAGLAPPPAKKGLKGFFSRVLSLGPNTEASPAETPAPVPASRKAGEVEAGAEGGTEAGAEAGAEAGTEAGAEAAAESTAEPGSIEPFRPAALRDSPIPEGEVPTSVLLSELQQEMGGIDKTLGRAQAEVNDLKREDPSRTSDRAKRWADGLMGELLTEKARLHELAKKLNQAVRQKELYFKNQERSLQQEIHVREEALKQKSHQLNRSKDQLTQANLTIERLKGGGIASADDAHYKQKYTHVQKLLVNAKDENVILKAQVEDSKGELNTLRQTVKRQNQMLAERANDKKRPEQLQMQRPGGMAPQAGNDEMKKKLEIANKQVASAQKEGDLLKLKFEEAQKEETRLKAEILRLQRQIANPGSAGGSSMARRPGGGTGKPPKAA